MQEVRLKYIARFQYGDALPKEDDQEGKFKVFGSNGPYSTFWKTNTKSPAIIVGRKGSYGKINWTEEPCYASDTTFFIDERSTKHDLRWLYYGLQTLNLDVGSNETAVPGLSRDDAYEKTLFVPSLNRQRAIAAILDRETARLDELVKEKEHLLELLTEKRHALITNAVTRGLNPNAPLVDSGVEWLGEIPGHWQIIRLKFLCHSLQTGPFGSQLHADDYVQNGIPVINPIHIINGIIKPSIDVCVDIETAERLSIHKLKLNDIVFARRGELGRCGVVSLEQEGWLCGTGSLRARPKKRILAKYLVEFVRNSGASSWLQSMSVGTTMENLNTEMLGEMPVLVLPLEEQQEIVEYIEAETGRIDQLQAATLETIELLKERRSSLIAAAVTGKISVREEIE